MATGLQWRLPSSLLLPIVLLASLQLWLNAGGVEAIGQVLGWKSRPQLWQGHTLYAGESMVNQVYSSASQLLGMLTLKMQTDCNLVLYGVPDGEAVWASNTAIGSPTCQLKVQVDGNLVIYDKGTPVWSSGTDGQGTDGGPYRLVAQDDGNLVLYGTRQQAVWATGTGTASQERERDMLLRAWTEVGGAG